MLFIKMRKIGDGSIIFGGKDKKICFNYVKFEIFDIFKWNY